MTKESGSASCPRCGDSLDAAKGICVRCGWWTLKVVGDDADSLLHKAEQRAGEAWAAGVGLAGEFLDCKAGIESLGEEMWKCAIAFRKMKFERDRARAELFHVRNDLDVALAMNVEMRQALKGGE